MFEKIREVTVSNDFFQKFIKQISIEYRIRNTLSKKFLQTVVAILFDQLIVSLVKFGKSFTKNMIRIIELGG